MEWLHESSRAYYERGLKVACFCSDSSCIIIKFHSLCSQLESSWENVM
jgi:hypothetical protein